MLSFDFSSIPEKEIKETIKEMRKVMHLDGGIGLSANQVNLPWRMFIVEYNNKLSAFFNPEITKVSEKKTTMEEGCLSIPKIFIPVERFERVTLEAVDQNGKKVKVKAVGVLARIFQHEIDHLNGKLITDYQK